MLGLRRKMSYGMPPIYLSVKQDKEVRTGYVLCLAPVVQAVGMPRLRTAPCFCSGDRMAQWASTQPEVRQTRIDRWSWRWQWDVRLNSLLWFPQWTGDRIMWGIMENCPQNPWHSTQNTLLPGCPEVLARKHTLGACILHIEVLFLKLTFPTKTMPRKEAKSRGGKKKHLLSTFRHCVPQVLDKVHDPLYNLELDTVFPILLSRWEN